jgi:hypothetical protein
MQKQPTTQFLVQSGLCSGRAQVGAQAEPQAKNSSFSGHVGIEEAAAGMIDCS